MNFLRISVLCCLLAVSPCPGMQSDNNKNQFSTTSVALVSSFAMLGIASCIQWFFDETKPERLDVEPVLCYAGEWQKMFCSVVKTSFDQILYVCYKN